jgi:uncharacterized phage infection (PIP) family protein YhgE
MPADSAAPATDAAASEDAGSEGGDVTFIGDMTPDEFMQLLTAGLSQALQPLMDAMTKQAEAATNAVTKEAKAQTDSFQALSATLKQVADKVKELEGDAPKGSFRASESPATVINPVPVLKQSEDDLSKLASFMIKGQ